MAKDSSSLMTLGLLSVAGYFVYEKFFNQTPVAASAAVAATPGAAGSAGSPVDSATHPATSAQQAPGYAAVRYWLMDPVNDVQDPYDVAGAVHDVRGMPTDPRGGEYSLAGMGSLLDGGGGTDSSGNPCTPGWDSGCSPVSNPATSAQPGDISIDWAVANSFLNANAPGASAPKTGLAAVPVWAWLGGGALLFLGVAGSGGRR